MPLTLTEQPGRRITKNVSTNILTQAELRYVAYEDTNDFNIRAFIEPQFPRKFENLVWDTYDLSERTDSPGTWDISSRYVLPQDSSDQQHAEPVSMSFNTTGGTTTIKFSRRTKVSKVCPFNPQNAAKQPKNHKQAINVGEDGPEGTDKFVPQLEISWTYNVLAAAINPIAIYEMSGKVNSQFWRGFPPGTLLFLGCDGSANLGADGKLTYKFAAKPGQTNLSVNQSQKFAADGWDYVWVQFDKRPDADAKGAANVPIAVYVEEIYEREDFYLLGIG